MNSTVLRKNSPGGIKQISNKVKVIGVPPGNVGLLNGLCASVRFILRREVLSLFSSMRDLTPREGNQLAWSHTTIIKQWNGDFSPGFYFYRAQVPNLTVFFSWAQLVFIDFDVSFGGMLTSQCQFLCGIEAGSGACIDKFISNKAA